MQHSLPKWNTVGDAIVLCSVAFLHGVLPGCCVCTHPCHSDVSFRCGKGPQGIQDRLAKEGHISTDGVRAVHKEKQAKFKLPLWSHLVAFSTTDME